MRLVNYSGKLPENVELNKSAPYVVTFAIYAEENGGAPLWQETQTVAVDADRRYTVQLGATTSGLPADLFPSDQPRWLGVQPQGGLEQPRVLLVSVPYAIKAGEADKLAGHSPSDFVTTESLQSAVQQQLQQLNVAPLVGTATATTKTTLETGSHPADVQPATNFVDNTTNQVVSVQQNGSGAALTASAPASSAIVGTTNATASPSIIAGVEGVSSLNGSFGVYGEATSTSSSSPGIGVYGQSNSPNGVGVGAIAAGTGSTVGVVAQATSTSGFAIDATETATSGNTVGLLSRINSPTGTGALIVNSASAPVTAPLISARTSRGVQFQVSGTGDVNMLGSLTSNGAVKGIQLVSTTNNGNPPFQVTSTTQVPNLNASLLGGLSSSGFIQNSMTQQVNTNFNIDGIGTVGGYETVGSNPSVYGQVAMIPDYLDSFHSETGQAGQNFHFRLSSAQPGPGGGQDFLIVPYAYGMEIEYAGVLEAWVDDFSVHTNQRFQSTNTPARFWVGDESDLGGLFVTAMNNGGGSNSYVDLAADRFTHQSHGTMQFQVRNQTDGYKFQWGPYHSEVTRAYLSNTTTATNLSLIYGSVQGVFTADSNNNGLISLGSTSATPVSLVAGNSPVANIFPDGNVSIGNSQDAARLLVGSSGLFSVSDAGAVAAASLTANSVTASSLNTSSLNLSGSLSATNVTASGMITSGSLNTGALTATALNANTTNSNSVATSSLTLGNGTPIIGHLSVVASITFAAFAGNSCETQTAAVPGASDGDTVVLGIPNVLGSVDGVTWFAWVSAAGVVSIRGCNATSMPTMAPPPASIRFDVWQH